MLISFRKIKIKIKDELKIKNIKINELSLAHVKKK